MHEEFYYEDHFMAKCPSSKNNNGFSAKGSWLTSKAWNEGLILFMFYKPWFFCRKSGFRFENLTQVELNSPIKNQLPTWQLCMSSVFHSWHHQTYSEISQKFEIFVRSYERRTDLRKIVKNQRLITLKVALLTAEYVLFAAPST